MLIMRVGCAASRSMTDDLTSVDIRILTQIQKDASLSTSELAEKVGISQSPCWRRLQKLKDDGYIRRQVAILDRMKFGLELVVFAKIKMTTQSELERKEFLSWIDQEKSIVECYTMFGDIDIQIKILAPSLPWYEDFIFRVLLKLPGVVDVHSTIALTEVKYETAAPVRGNRAL